jgi:CelD/BcsL family acetyltransferase involved in cellulose biosynthesis
MTTVAVREATKLEVKPVTDFGAFVELERVWDRLVAAAGIEHPFLSHDWVRTWWENFGEGKRLHILLLTKGGEPAGIVPLMHGSARIYGIKVRQLEFIYNAHTPRFDFIVPQATEETYRAIWSYLIDIEDSWDVLKLPQLASDSPTIRHLERFAAESRCRAACWFSTQSPYLSLSGTWDGYFAALDRKHRSNIRNRLNRLQRIGPVELQVISDEDEALPALADGLALEAKAWKGRAGTAILCRPELQSFYRNIALCAARRGWLRLNFLVVNGRKIAFDFSLLHGKRMFVLKPGYDPDYAPLSPYNTLCYMKLREAFAAGLLEYDFLGIDDSWKLDWTETTRPHYWLYVFSGRARPALLHYAKFQLAPQLQKYPLFRTLRNIWAGMWTH